MIFCKNCGYEGIYTGTTCPNCKNKIQLTEEEIRELISELKKAKAASEYETVVENYKILADYGITEAEREYGKMLEKGGIVPRNLDMAMEYLSRAAKKQDPQAAYRYSRLISRMSDEYGSFWLMFSALLGCPEAYLPAAEDFAAKGMYEYSNFYYYLAAACDEVDAIVALAEKYYTGLGIEKSPEYAKWYMEKLTFPPFHAIKLAYRLRSVKAKEAPTITCPSSENLIRMLYSTAKRLGFDSARLALVGMLSDKGDIDAETELGIMYLCGIGTEKNPTEAIRALTRAAASGNKDAYMHLGRIYIDGEVTEKNPTLALNYLKKSAELGNNDAYELMADIYHDPEYEERDVAYAWELYEKAARGNNQSAKEKADKIAAARKAYFEHAEAAKLKEPHEAFKSYTISSVMGYLPATLKLAECYILGIGTKKSNAMAFDCYKEAAEKGSSEAVLALGLCYSRGIGTQFDFKLAIDMLGKAERLGHAKARGEILRLYENKKKRLSKKLYSTGMRLMYQKKFAAAAQYLEIATRFKNAKAIYTLGCLYEFGRGVECDRSKAYELYSLAIENNFSDKRSSYKLTVLRFLKNYR